MSTQQPILDPPTRSGVLQLCLYCWLLYAIGPITLLLRDEFTLSRSSAAAHATAMAVGFFIAGLVSPRILATTDNVRLRRNSLLSLAVGMSLLAAGSFLAMTLLGALVCGFSGALLVNALNHALPGHHNDRSAAALSVLNAAGATAGISAPLLIGFATGAGVSWRWLVAAVAAVTAVVALRSRHGFTSNSHLATDFAGGGGAGTGKNSTRYRVAVISVLAGMAIEYTVALFASDAMRTQGRLATGSATAWAASFMVGFAAGRWLVARLSRQMPAATIMVGAYTLCSVGALMVATSQSAVSAACGLLLLGLGSGPAYPLLIALALSHAPISAARAVSGIGVLSGVFIGLAPFVIGRLADLPQLGIGFMFYALCGTALAAAGLMWHTFVYASRRTDKPHFPQFS